MSLEQYQGDMNMCCRCSACKWIPMQRVSGYDFANVCPSISRYHFHSYSGGGRMNIGAALLRGEIGYTDRLLDIIYNCQMCGACGVSCNYAMDMNVMEPLYEMRIRCVAEGKTLPALDQAIAGLRKTDSIIPPKGRRGDWAQDLGLKDVAKEKVEVLLYAGDITSYDPESQKLAWAAARILQKAGVEFGIAGDAEISSGDRAYQMGYQQDFLNLARRNMEYINRHGIRCLVTADAESYHAFKVLYDKFKLRGNLRVMHISEYIRQLLQDGKLKLKKKVDLNVTWHDPCHLGRLGEPWVHWEGKKVPGDRFVFDPPKQYRRGTHGVYDAPRAVLNSIPGVRLTEMTRIREYAWCCGSGGGVGRSNPEFAQWTAGERIDEAETTGAEALVTACPWCQKLFNRCIAAGGSRLKVYDLVELVEQALA
jgi:Fe-S oxidoreductase